MDADVVVTFLAHHTDVIMGTIAYQITSLTIVYSAVYSGADQRKHHSSASLAFVWENSPVTGEFPAQMASNAENVSIWWRHHGYFPNHALITSSHTDTDPCPPITCAISVSRIDRKWEYISYIRK